MKRLLFILTGMVICMTMFSQECKVLKKEISETYEGDCKKGLAHGKGVAKGIDRYEGNFRKGFPHGSGTYYWHTGEIYKGLWKNGKRNGKGKYSFKTALGKDTTQIGVWKNDTYAGTGEPAYKMKRKINVSRYSIRKKGDHGNTVYVKVTQQGQALTDLDNLTISYESGSQSRSGDFYLIEQMIFPVTIQFSYRLWNALHTSQMDVDFEFVINEPGTWEVNVQH